MDADDIPVLDEVIFSLLDLVKDGDPSVQVSINSSINVVANVHFTLVVRSISSFLEVRRTSANHQLGLLRLLCQVLGIATDTNKKTTTTDNGKEPADGDECLLDHEQDHEGERPDLDDDLAKSLADFMVNEMVLLKYGDGRQRAMGDVLVCLASSNPPVTFETILSALDKQQDNQNPSQNSRKSRQLEATVLLEVITDLASTVPAQTAAHFQPLMVRLLPLLTASVTPQPAAQGGTPVTLPAPLKAETQRISLVKAFAALCQAVVDGAAEGEGKEGRIGPQGESQPAQLVGTALEVLLTGSGLQQAKDALNKDSSVRLHTLEALGFMASVVTAERLQHHAQSLLGLFIQQCGTAKKEAPGGPSPLPMLRGLASFLHSCSESDPAAIEASLSPLTASLFALLTPVSSDSLYSSQPPQFHPSLMRCQAEILKCVEVVWLGWTDNVLGFLLGKLQSKQKDDRIGALTVLRHIASSPSCHPALQADPKERIDKLLNTLQSLTLDHLYATSAPTVADNTAALSLIELIVALATSGFLQSPPCTAEERAKEVEAKEWLVPLSATSQALLQYIMKLAATSESKLEKDKAATRGREGVGLRDLRDRANLVLTGQLSGGAPRLMWGLAIAAIVHSQYTAALSVLCKCAGNIIESVQRKRGHDYMLRALSLEESVVALPGPHVLLSRLFLFAHDPFAKPNQGVCILEGLRSLAPLIHPTAAEVWEASPSSRLQELIAILQEGPSVSMVSASGPTLAAMSSTVSLGELLKDFQQEEWHALLMRELHYLLQSIDDGGGFAVRLTDSLQNTFADYKSELAKAGTSGSIESIPDAHRCGVYGLLGACMRNLKGANIQKVTAILETLLATGEALGADVFRRACARGIGFAAAEHFDVVLMKLQSIAKTEAATKKAGPFAIFGKFAAVLHAEHLRATIALSLGYCAKYAPCGPRRSEAKSAPGGPTAVTLTLPIPLREGSPPTKPSEGTTKHQRDLLKKLQSLVAAPLLTALKDEKEPEVLLAVVGAVQLMASAFVDDGRGGGGVGDSGGGGVEEMARSPSAGSGPVMHSLVAFSGADKGGPLGSLRDEILTALLQFITPPPSRESVHPSLIAASAVSTNFISAPSLVMPPSALISQQQHQADGKGVGDGKGGKGGGGGKDGQQGGDGGVMVGPVTLTQLVANTLEAICSLIALEPELKPDLFTTTLDLSLNILRQAIPPQSTTLSVPAPPAPTAADKEKTVQQQQQQQQQPVRASPTSSQSCPFNSGGGGVGGRESLGEMYEQSDAVFKECVRGVVAVVTSLVLHTNSWLGVSRLILAVQSIGANGPNPFLRWTCTHLLYSVSKEAPIVSLSPPPPPGPIVAQHRRGSAPHMQPKEGFGPQPGQGTLLPPSSLSPSPPSPAPLHAATVADLSGVAAAESADSSPDKSSQSTTTAGSGKGVAVVDRPTPTPTPTSVTLRESHHQQWGEWCESVALVIPRLGDGWDEIAVMGVETVNQLLARCPWTKEASIALPLPHGAAAAGDEQQRDREREASPLPPPADEQGQASPSVSFGDLGVLTEPVTITSPPDGSSPQPPPSVVSSPVEQISDILVRSVPRECVAPLVQHLMLGMQDSDEGAAKAAMETLGAILQARCTQLSVESARKLVTTMLDEVRKVKAREVTHQALLSVRMLATHHFQATVAELIDRGPEYDDAHLGVFEVIARERPLLLKTLSHLTDTINNSDPGDANTPNKLVLSATAAVAHLFGVDDSTVRSVVRKYLPELLSTFLLRIGTTAGGIGTDTAIHALGNFLRASQQTSLSAAVERRGLLAKCRESYDEGIADVAAMFFKHYPDGRPGVFRFVEPFLGREILGHRVGATATLAQLVFFTEPSEHQNDRKSTKLTQGDVDRLMSCLLDRTQDAAPVVRKHAYRAMSLVAYVWYKTAKTSISSTVTTLPGVPHAHIDTDSPTETPLGTMQRGATAPASYSSCDEGSPSSMASGGGREEGGAEESNGSGDVGVPDMDNTATQVLECLLGGLDDGSGVCVVEALRGLQRCCAVPPPSLEWAEMLVGAAGQLTNILNHQEWSLRSGGFDLLSRLGTAVIKFDIPPPTSPTSPTAAAAAADGDKGNGDTKDALRLTLQRHFLTHLVCVLVRLEDPSNAVSAAAFQCLQAYSTAGLLADHRHSSGQQDGETTRTRTQTEQPSEELYRLLQRRTDERLTPDDFLTALSPLVLQLAHSFPDNNAPAPPHAPPPSDLAGVTSMVKLACQLVYDCSRYFHPSCHEHDLPDHHEHQGADGDPGDAAVNGLANTAVSAFQVSVTAASCSAAVALIRAAFHMQREMEQTHPEFVCVEPGGRGSRRGTGNHPTTATQQAMLSEQTEAEWEAFDRTQKRFLGMAVATCRRLLRMLAIPDTVLRGRIARLLGHLHVLSEMEDMDDMADAEGHDVDE